MKVCGFTPICNKWLVYIYQGDGSDITREFVSRWLDRLGGVGESVTYSV